MTTNEFLNPWAIVKGIVYVRANIRKREGSEEMAELSACQRCVAADDLTLCCALPSCSMNYTVFWIRAFPVVNRIRHPGINNDCG